MNLTVVFYIPEDGCMVGLKHVGVYCVYKVI